MTGMNSFIASYFRNYQSIWEERLEALEYYLTRMKRDEKKTNKYL